MMSDKDCIDLDKYLDDLKKNENELVQPAATEFKVANKHDDDAWSSSSEEDA